MRVQFYENNSGGRRWLKEPQWAALRDAGWTLFVMEWRGKKVGDDLTPERVEMHDGHDAPYALSPEVKSVRSAIKQWEDLTEQESDEEGCNCCGNPYNFSEEKEPEPVLSAPWRAGAK